ncbi:hypothetical protein LPJ56_006257, partial [Coemansia sp. RSA 2599]
MCSAPYNNRKLPSHVLKRILAYVFWEAPRSHAEGCGLSNHASRHFGTIGTLPVGHISILGALHSCRYWRKRAARLFYGTAVISVGHRTQTILEEYEQPTDLCRRRISTNIALVMGSGYAPKTERLLVYVNAPVSAEQMTEALAAFSQWEWPAIDSLYYYDPQKLASNAGGQWAHDQAIGLLNRQLAASLPALRHIRALSAMRDSFGLFVLDDLVLAKHSQLLTLEVQSTTDILALLAPDIHGLALTLNTMTIRAAHNADILRIPATVAEGLEKLDIDPIAPDTVWAPFATGTLGDFLRLRLLRLGFVSRLSTVAKHHQRQSSATSADSVHSNAYPLFPELCELV